MQRKDHIPELIANVTRCLKQQPYYIRNVSNHGKKNAKLRLYTKNEEHFYQRASLSYAFPFLSKIFMQLTKFNCDLFISMSRNSSIALFFDNYLFFCLWT